MKNTLFCTKLNSTDLKLYESLNLNPIILEGLVGLYRDAKQDLEALPSLEEMKELVDENISNNSSTNMLVEMTDILEAAPKDNNGNLLTSSGKKSKLSPTQYARIRTKSFINTYGDWLKEDSSRFFKIVDGEISKDDVEILELLHAFDPINIRKNVLLGNVYTKEMLTIKEEAIADGTFMKAPNGNPTNLDERQWIHVRTKAFKNWFGDWENDAENASKVIDENGEPLVVYHHTDNPNLTEFDIDFPNYFSQFKNGTKKAIFFDEEPTGTLNRKYDIPVFLNIKDLVTYRGTKEDLHKQGTDYTEVVNKSAERNDIDGGLHMADFDDNKKEHQDVWIIHNPNQVKSATDNIGSYSTDDNNINNLNATQIIPGSSVKETAIKLNTGYSINALEKLFKKYNKDDDRDNLFDKVFEVAKSLSIELKFVDNIQVLGRNKGNVIEVNSAALQEANIHHLPHILLHELIHAVTVAYIDAYNNNALTDKNIISAVENIIIVYESIKNDTDLEEDYGITNVKEMLAELSNITFREKLKRLNVWDKLKESIKSIFIKGSPVNLTAYKTLSASFDYILDNYDNKVFFRYVHSIKNNKWDSLESPTTSPEYKNIIKDTKNIKKATAITRKQIKSSPDTLYVYTDNYENYKEKKSLFEDYDNAVAVITKKSSENKWEDSDSETAESLIKESFTTIKNLWSSGVYKKIVIRSNKNNDVIVNSNSSEITKSRVSNIYATMVENLNDLCKYIKDSSRRIVADNNLGSNIYNIKDHFNSKNIKFDDSFTAYIPIIGTVNIPEGISIEQIYNSLVANKPYTEDEQYNIAYHLWLYWRIANNSKFQQFLKDSLGKLLYSNVSTNEEAISKNPYLTINMAKIFADLVNDYYTEDFENYKHIYEAVQNKSWAKTDDLEVKEIDEKEYNTNKSKYDKDDVYILTEDDLRTLNRFSPNKPIDIFNDPTLNSLFEEIVKKKGKDLSLIVARVNEALPDNKWQNAHALKIAIAKYLQITDRLPVDTQLDGTFAASAIANTLEAISTPSVSKSLHNINSISLNVRNNVSKLLALEFDRLISLILIRRRNEAIKSANSSEGLDKSKIEAVYKLNSGDPSVSITYLLKMNGVFDLIIKNIHNYINKNSEAKKDTAEGRLWELLKSEDNFAAFLEYAAGDIQNATSINISLKKVEEEDTSENSEIPEEEDDTEVSHSAGNAGWNYKARYVDHYKSLSKKIRRLLSKLKNPSSTEEFSFIPLSHSYNTIMSIFANDVLSSKDFIIVGEDGKYQFPSLQKYAKQFPWIDTLITTLSDDDLLAAEFYTNFRLDFIRYMSVEIAVDEEGNKIYKPTSLNAPTYHNNLWTPTKTAFEAGLELTENSLHARLDKGTFSDNKKAISEDIKNRINNIPEQGLESILLPEESAKKEAEELSDLLKKVNINITPEELFMLLFSRNGTLYAFSKNRNGLYKYSELLKLLERVVEKIVWDKKFEKPNIDATYSAIGQLGNSLEYVPMLNTVYTFTYGDKMRQSYSAPSMFDKIFKSFRLNKDTKKYIELWEKDPFYNPKYNPIIENIITRSKSPERLFASGYFMDYNTLDLAYIDKKEFKDWTTEDINNAFVSLYYLHDESFEYSTYSYYNVPITSNTPSAKFVMLKRLLSKGSPEQIEYVNTAGNIDTIISIIEQSYKNIGIDTPNEYHDEIPLYPILSLIPKYRELVLQELERISRVQQRKELSAQGENIINIAGFDNAGLKFCTFPELNTFLRSKDGVAQTLLKVLQNSDTTPDESIDKIEIIDEYIVDLICSKTEQFIKDYRNHSPKSQFTNEQLFNYYFDSTLGTTYISQVLFGDPAYHINEVTQAKRAKEICSAGPQPCTTIKGGKDTYKVIVVKDRIFPSLAFNKVRDILKKLGMDSTQLRALLKDFLNINGTDGQAWRTIDSLIMMYKMYGRFDKAKEITYNNIKNSKTDIVNLEDLDNHFLPFKSFIYTYLNVAGENGNSSVVPTQLKHCESILFDSYKNDSLLGHSKSVKLAFLHKFMKDHGIDVIECASNYKVGSFGILDINYNIENLESTLENLKSNYPNLAEDIDKWTSDWDDIKEHLDNLLLDEKITWEHYIDTLKSLEYSEEQFGKLEKYLENNMYSNSTQNPNYVKEIPYEDYVEAQTVTDHLFDTQHLIGGQFKHISKSDFPQDFKIDIGTRSFTGAQVKSIIEDILASITLDGLQTASKKIGSLQGIRNLVSAQIKGNSLSKHLLDFFSITTNAEGNEEFAIPLNHPSNRKDLETTLYSTVRKYLAKLYTTGGAATAVSSYGSDLTIEFDSKGGLTKVECELPFSYRKYYEKYIDKDGKLDLAKVPERLRQIIGYRIPTENKYSLIPLYIKGFLPAYMGASIKVAPEAMVLLTGGDHDGDHIHMMFRPYDETNYTPTTDVFSLSRKEREEFLFDTIWKVITSPTIAKQILSPGHFRDMKWSRLYHDLLNNPNNISTLAEHFGISLEMPNNENATLSSIYDSMMTFAYKILNLSLDDFNAIFKGSSSKSPFTVDSYTKLHKSIAAGDTLIGAGALNTIGTMKIQNSDGDNPILLQNDYTTELYVDNNQERPHILNSINEMYTYEGGLVSSECAQTSAAFVDNAKDPTAEGGNLNTKTFDVLAGILRMGVPLKHALIIMNLPYITEDFNTKGKISKIAINKLNLPENLLAESINIQQIIADSLFCNYIKSYSNSEKNPNIFNAWYTTFYRYANIINKLVDISKPVQVYTTESKIDSIKGAIKNSLGEVTTQLAEYDYKRKTLDKYLEPGFFEYVLRIQNNNFDSLKEMYSYIKETSKVPDVQATLTATEIAHNKVLRVFGQDSTLFSHYIDTLFANAGYKTYNIGPFIENFYNDFPAFVCSDTALFGNDGESTYDTKYKYYLDNFPLTFKNLIESPEFKKSEIGKLNIWKVLMPSSNTAGKLEISLKKASSMSKETMEIYRAELDFVVSEMTNNYYATHKQLKDVPKYLASGLFMYAFYKWGLKPRSDNYVSLFSAFFLQHFPEYLETLRKIETSSDYMLESYLDRYLDQFYGNYMNNYTNVKLYLPKIDVANISEDNTYDIEYKEGAPIYSHILATFTDENNSKFVELCKLVENTGAILTYKKIHIETSGGLRYNVNRSDMAHLNLIPVKMSSEEVDMISESEIADAEENITPIVNIENEIVDMQNQTNEEANMC